jgi:FkbM family methyltransferase
MVVNLSNNKKLFIKSSIADNYGRLILGKWNEPETHIFIKSISKSMDSFVFIDIGANVGEFVLDLFDNSKVKMIYAFEPQQDHFYSLNQLMKINNITNAEIINKAVSDKNGIANFNINKNNKSNSSLVNTLEGSIEVETIKIDTFFKDKEPLETPIILIDVEGAELDVMKGGNGFIRKHSPIIIFEYNHVTRKFFQIDDVKDVLGSSYKVFRLNRNGSLDSNFDTTWNLVAIPNSFNF